MTKISARWSVFVWIAAWTLVAVQGCSDDADNTKRDGGRGDAPILPTLDASPFPDLAAADAPLVAAMDGSVGDSVAGEAMGLDVAPDLAPYDQVPYDGPSLDGTRRSDIVDVPAVDVAVDWAAIDGVVDAGRDGGVDTGAVSCGAGGFIGTPGSLLSNGGFECPVVGHGSFINYSVGQQFFGWTAVGASGQVSVLSGAYVSGAYKWPAKSEAQTIDLTGYSSNSATGISQSIPTASGTKYRLSFWVGNMNAPNTTWGTTSTVNVLIDGVQTLAAKNDEGAGSAVIAWKQFALDFTASVSSTSLSFINGDPPGDNSNLLDDVTLEPLN